MGVSNSSSSISDSLISKIRDSLASGAATPISRLDPESQARVDDQIADTKLKKLYARRFVWILIGQLLAMNLIFVAVGLEWLKFTEPTYLNLFMGGTLAEVFGVVFVITRYLFSKK